MAYGETMAKLSPCGDGLICETISEFCPRAGSVLDIGCGRGERLAALEKSFPGWLLAGVDMDGDMVELARGNTKADIHLASADALPFASGSFGLALCECSLSLFHEPEKSLGEMHRVLAPGGVLLLAELFTKLDCCESSVGGSGTIGRVYPKSRIEQMLHKAGFFLLYYEDRSGDLLSMAAQMIMDGSCAGCLGAEDFALLRRVKAGYGLWIFKKEDF